MREYQLPSFGAAFVFPPERRQLTNTIAVCSRQNIAAARNYLDFLPTAFVVAGFDPGIRFCNGRRMAAAEGKRA